MRHRDTDVELLLKRDQSSKIRARVGWCVKKHADPSNAVTTRIARKVGLLYAASWIAQRAGLLPWPDNRPRQVAKYVYEEIIRGLTTRDRSLDDLVGKLRSAVDDNRIFLIRAGNNG